MIKKSFVGCGGTFGLAVAASLMASSLATQAASLWGDVSTFMTVPDLNGARVQFSYEGTTRHVYAGVFRADMSDGHSFLAFCTDALNTVRSGYFQPFDSMPVNNPETNPIWATGGGERAAIVYNAHISSVYGMPGSTGHGSTAGDIAAAALQVAIWKALYDDTLDLSAGSFRVVANGSALQNDIIAQASLFLNGAFDPETGGNGNANAMWWRPVDENNSLRIAQGLIGPISNPPSVPAPEGFLLVSLLAGGFGFLARRRMSV